LTTGRNEPIGKPGAAKATIPAYAARIVAIRFILGKAESSMVNARLVRDEYRVLIAGR
jgi:hypothetical protein